MTDIMASLGLGQLQIYPEILKRRKQIIKMYDEGLSDYNVDVLKHYDDDFGGSGYYKLLSMHTAYKRLGFDIEDYPNVFDMEMRLHCYYICY